MIVFTGLLYHKENNLKTKENVIEYLEKKLECFNKEKINENKFCIKVYMSESIFDLISDELTEIEFDTHSNKICFGIYKECLIWNRIEYGESILAFIDKNTKDDILTYV